MKLIVVLLIGFFAAGCVVGTAGGCNKKSGGCGGGDLTDSEKSLLTYLMTMGTWDQMYNPSVTLGQNIEQSVKADTYIKGNQADSIGLAKAQGPNSKTLVNFGTETLAGVGSTSYGVGVSASMKDDPPAQTPPQDDTPPPPPPSSPSPTPDSSPAP